MKRILLACVLTLLATPLAAATIKVCTSSCDYTNGQLQTALDAAMPGDTILLEETIAYVGDFILPNQKSCPAQDDTCYIHLQTGLNATGAVQSATRYPAANMRTAPSYTSVLAKLRNTSNNASALRTTYPGEIRTGCAVQPCISAFWIIQHIEFQTNAWAGGSEISLGSNDPAGFLPNSNAQDTLAKVPHHFKLIQVYEHGDPVHGVKRGLYINAKNVWVLDSDFRDNKGVAQDTQAIACLNTPGEIVITNNYLEAAGENVICGGDDALIKQNVTITSGASTTGATLSAVTDLAIGQGISVIVSGANQMTYVTGIAGLAVTWSPALTGTPTTPGSVRWNVVPHNLTFTKNLVPKPQAWRQPIIDTPQNVTTNVVNTGGSLTAGTYNYRVVCKLTAGQGALARSTPSVEVAAVVDGGVTTGKVTVAWAAVTNAEYCHVFGRNGGAENFRMYTTGTSVIDTGAAAGVCSTESTNNCTEVVPDTIGTTWTVKNNFELKAYHTATIQGNIFGPTWTHTQSGYSILLTVINQYGENPSNEVSHIVFRDNKIQHAAAGLQITGRGTTSGGVTMVSHDYQIINNSWEDLGSAWGNGWKTVVITTATNPTGEAPYDLTFDHQTFFQVDGPDFLEVNAYDGTQHTSANFVWKNNIQRRLVYGLRNVDNGGVQAEGNTSWLSFTAGASAFSKNIIIDAPCSVYPSPSSNFCPTESAMQAEFVNYAGGNYRLKSTSAYHLAGLDNTDIGANYDTIEAFTNIALSGNNAGGVAPAQPTITTSTPLPQGQLGVFYTTTLAAASGTPPYTWTIASGLPTGVTLAGSTGVLSGTPTGSAGTFSFTARVTDALAQTASKLMALSIVQPQFPEPRPDKLFYNEGINFRRGAAPGSAEQIRVGDNWFDLTENRPKYLLSTAPSAIWRQYATPAVVNMYGWTFNGQGWTAMPAGLTELFGQGDARHRRQLDLTVFRQVRLTAHVQTPCAATGVLRAQYSTDGGASWAYFNAAGSTPSLACDVANYSVGTWVAVDSAAQADVLVRIVGLNGNGVTSPLWTGIDLQFR